MKPRPLLTERQAGMLTVLKDEVPGFAVIRRLAIRFQSLLRHRDETKLEPWLTAAKGCGIPSCREFRQDTDGRHRGGAQRGDRALEQRSD